MKKTSLFITLALFFNLFLNSSHVPAQELPIDQWVKLCSLERLFHDAKAKLQEEGQDNFEQIFQDMDRFANSLRLNSKERYLIQVAAYRKEADQLRILHKK